MKRVEAAAHLQEQPIRLTMKERYKAQQGADAWCTCVVWDPLGDSPGLVTVHNPMPELRDALRVIVAARVLEIPPHRVRGAMQEE